MAFDEGVAQRIREVLDAEPEVVEKKMFGGLAFMIGGHMCCGVADAKLMPRVGKDAYSGALTEPHVEPMDFTGRPLTGFVYVLEEGIESERDLVAWIDRCVSFVESLPPK